MKRLQRIFCLALLAALMLSLSVVSHADTEPTFEYELSVTDASGKELTSLSGLKSGAKINLSVVLTRTDTDDHYGVYGLEFKVLSRGLQYNGDGVDFRGGNEVTLNKYIAGDLVGITYYDMTREGEMIANPLNACSWSYTVTDPSAVNLELTTAIVFPNGKTESSHPEGNARLTLDPNGGRITGTDVSGEYKSGTVVTLPDAARSGYRFDGWSDGVKTYPAGGSYTVSGVVTLTAQWTRLVKLTLNGNGGTIGNDVSGEYPIGTEVTLPSGTRDDYVFTSWQAGDGTTYKAGNKVTLNADVTLTAQWEKKPAAAVHVKLNLAGGTIVGTDVSGDYLVGQSVTLPSARRSGYSFDGWRDSAAGKVYDPGATLTLYTDTELTAVWTAEGGGGGPVIIGPSTPPVKPTVETGSHYNYIMGYPDGTFRPQNNITRAEVAAIIYRILSADSRNTFMTTVNGFTDVSPDAWYNQSVSTLARAGILEGYPDGTFRPNSPITRAEMATVISRFTNITGGTARFSDVATHWALSYIATAADNGWVNGYPDGTFKPNNYITRAETVTMVNRLLNRAPETEADLLSGMTTFSDNRNAEAWYYLQVQEAANNHDYQRKADKVHEKWTAKLTDIAW